MNRTVKAIIAVIFVLVITFSAVSICQNLSKSLKLDITDQKLYTLSDGTKAILAKLNKPIKVKLYYAKTAALKGPDRLNTSTTTMSSSNHSWPNTLPQPME